MSIMCIATKTELNSVFGIPNELAELIISKFPERFTNPIEDGDDGILLPNGIKLTRNSKITKDSESDWIIKCYHHSLFDWRDFVLNHIL